ncbi:prepilin-type N-terminal cleavage/methylation domain-containing protein [Bacillus sp. FJAT-47783]|uniref:type IV pilin protein n=1 Tax=Bacillus sp. FJAT-47783 TaxID=2922712 RepID=UPI001FAE49C4|nr:prepilin-type N-terminal cleavage/methylation domain-containing protein [Bacillus sp. FJAT-47783]
MVKKYFNNERGLTLVELLAVIVILGIIAAVAVPSIGNIIQKSKEDGVKADAIAVLNAAKLYVIEQNVKSKDDTSSISLTKDALIEGGYLEEAGTEWSTEPTVTYNAKNELTISGAAEAGKVTLTFSNATLKDINKDTSGDEATTIGTGK